MTAKDSDHAAMVLDRLLGALEEASEYAKNDQVAPAVILWTDKDRQWEPLMPRLRKELRELLTLGPCKRDSDTRTGPAVWARCMVERTLPEADWSADEIPILYLPGVSRQELRAVEDCPRALSPLAELQYRGVFFTQVNAKDWTVGAFLRSRHGGLGLDVAGDRATAEAMLNALARLAETPVESLRGRRLEAADFHELLAPDMSKRLLEWLNDPKSARKMWNAEEWASFSSGCREKYGFDPERDGELVAAERLGRREGSWGPVWARFAEAPKAYPKLPQLLRRAKPHREDDLFFKRDAWPQCNDSGEAELRDRLSALATEAPEAASREIEKLESAHGPRRDWIWATLGESPLAQALKPLVQLARATRRNLGGSDPAAMATTYISEGWQADAAALDAMALVSRNADVEAVKAAVNAVYRPWLEAGANHFQDLVREHPLSGYEVPPKELTGLEPGTCVLFGDGLRFDVAQRLKAALQDKGLRVEDGWRWVPLPPVTPTAKPAASPIADLLGNTASGEQFVPAVKDTGKALTIDRFRKLLSDRGFQDLRGNDLGDPSGLAWTEYGEIDSRGHKEGWKLARRVAEEVHGLVDRITSLLDAAWREIRVVTDHGWLLLPGGLPKVEMPSYLVLSRWTRCGSLKSGSKVELPTAPWFWNEDVQIVMAPGISSFVANIEYSHGSLSLQECLVPSLIIRPVAPTGPAAAFEEIHWVGLRCRVRLTAAPPGARVDLRTKVNDPNSSIAAKGKGVAADGTTSLLVEDPDLEGAAATLVLMNAAGETLLKRPVTVGDEG